MTSDVLFIRSSISLTRLFASDVMLAGPSGGEVALLAGTAAIMWDLLEEPRSLHDLAGMLCPSFEVPEEEILGDIEPLLRDLVNRKWVVEIRRTDE